jgi:HPr kinase/phosphorylase
MTAMSEIIHGCVVAIGEKGLLILGESGAGKSRLLVELMSDTSSPKARLVADDRVCLSKHGDKLVARPHPLIAGKIEIRGLGIQDSPHLEAVVLQSVLRLLPAKPARMPEKEALTITYLGVVLPCIGLPTQSFSALHFRAIWPHLK